MDPTQRRSAPFEPPVARRGPALGVDGCRAGWLVATLADDAVSLAVVDDDGLARAIDDAARVHIDMPIGLPDTDSARACDRQVRRALGAGATSRVFNPPVRAVLDATDYADACARNAAATGRRISKQTWFLVPRIRALDAIVRRGGRSAWTLEAHPEWQFAALAGRTLPRKKSAEGASERRALIARVLPGAVAAADALLATTRRAEVAPDDAWDALVLAWAAAQPAAALERAPVDDIRDGVGLPCAIWRARPTAGG